MDLRAPAGHNTHCVPSKHMGQVSHTAKSNSEPVHFSQESREGTTVMGKSKDAHPHKRKGRENNEDRNTSSHHVLVRSGCHNQIPQPGWPEQQSFTVSAFWKLEV